MFPDGANCWSRASVSPSVQKTSARSRSNANVMKVERSTRQMRSRDASLRAVRPPLPQRIEGDRADSAHPRTSRPMTVLNRFRRAAVIHEAMPRHAGQRGEDEHRGGQASDRPGGHCRAGAEAGGAPADPEQRGSADEGGVDPPVRGDPQASLEGRAQQPARQPITERRDGDGSAEHEDQARIPVTTHVGEAADAHRIWPPGQRQAETEYHARPECRQHARECDHNDGPTTSISANIAMPAARKVITAMIKRDDRRPCPATSWPLVQTGPSRVPKPTSRPVTTGTGGDATSSHTGPHLSEPREGRRPEQQSDRAASVRPWSTRTGGHAFSIRRPPTCRIAMAPGRCCACRGGRSRSSPKPSPVRRMPATGSTIVVEIVREPEGQVGFAVRPRRWVVERFVGWIGGNRCLLERLRGNPRLSPDLPLCRRCHDLCPKARKNVMIYRTDSKRPPHPSPDARVCRSVSPPAGWLGKRA